jgi:GH24 family phage-related lysozyme (muramidase)
MKLSVGFKTIGYGHLLQASELRTGKLFATDVPWQKGITEAQAEELLLSDVEPAAGGISRHVKVPLAQCQFDALVSFVFNVGVGAFMESTLLRKLNAGDYESVPSELRKWVNAGGQRLPGLVTRREAEAKMFTQGFNCDKVPLGV